MQGIYESGLKFDLSKNLQPAVPALVLINPNTFSFFGPTFSS